MTFRSQVVTTHEDATRAFAQCLSKIVDAGDVVCLNGDLGAGKTFLARALCEALRVPREAGVSSPTYCLVNRYEGGVYPIAHLDLYRLGDEDELEAIGFRDLLDGSTLVLIEWPERAPSLRSFCDWWIQIDDRGPQSRVFTVDGVDAQRAALLAESVESARLHAGADSGKKTP